MAMHSKDPGPRRPAAKPDKGERIKKRLLPVKAALASILEELEGVAGSDAENLRHHLKEAHDHVTEGIDYYLGFV